MSKFTEIVTQKVIKAVLDNSMLKNTTSIIVGFSGGADSVCLIHTLWSLKDSFSVSVEAVHVNHGIRGEEAKRDVIFCENFCDEYNIPFHVYEFDCISLSKEKKLTLEECGRLVRYDVFDKHCGEGSRIATAHNANDNAETVIFNLARGTGIKGVCGIPVVRGNVIRPLIYCTREEIEGYCKENNLSFVTDSTNLSDEYTRNKIRHRILPVMTTLNSGAVDNINNFSSVARDIDDYINFQAEKALNQAQVSANIYKTVFLSNLHNAVLHRCLSIAFSRLSELSLDREKINTISHVLKNGGRVQVYGDLYAESVKGCFRFFENTSSKTDDIVCVDSLNKMYAFNGYNIGISKKEQSSEILNKKLLDNLIDCDKIVGKLFLRCRCEGDVFKIRNRQGTKSLKKLFNEMNIPVEQREVLPILCDDNGIVWIFSVGVSDRCSVDENSRNIAFVRGENNDR